MRVVRFYQSSFLFSSSPLLLLSSPLLFSSSSRLPHLNCQLQIAMGAAGPQPPAPDHGGHCRTSTASPRSQWALQDLSDQLQISVSGHRRTSPHRMSEHTPDRMSIYIYIPDRRSEYMPDCQNVRQSKCQSTCQVECQSICQLERQQ